MADAQASFAITLDSSGLQAGAKSGLSAMERLGQRIQRLTKDLAAQKAAQQRLAQSAGVQEYLKREKAIERNQRFAEKAQKKAAELAAKKEAAENLAIAKQANVEPEELKKIEAAAAALGVTADDVGRLSEEAEKAAAKVAEVNEELADLKAKQEQLVADDKSVAAYRDQAKAIKANEAELADLQTQYSAAGGSATDLASEIKEPTQEVGSLMDKAKAAGGPIGELAGKFENLGAMAKAAGPLAMVAVLLAIAAAAIKATYALVKFIAISADAARSAARMRLSAAFGSEAGAKDITAAMAALRDNTAVSKEEAQALAAELYRLGDRGERLKETALTIERFGQLGDDAKQSVKGLYDELRKPTPAVGIAGGVAKSMRIGPDTLPRDIFLELAMQLGKDGNRALVQGFVADKDQIRAALARIGEQRFAGPALEQMQSLSKLSERLRENIDSLFEKVKIGVLLGALQKLVAILDEGSAAGKAIRDVLGAFGQTLTDAIGSILPYVEVFIKGLIFGGLTVALVALKIKNALGSLIPSSLTKNIDWLKVAFYVAAGIVVALALAFTALATSVLLLTWPFVLLTALVALLVVGLVVALDYVVGWFDEVSAAFEDVDFGSLATTILDGIIAGFRDGAKALYDAVSDVAMGAYDAFKSAIKSKSPSVLFRMAGRTIPEGTALGIEDETPQVESAVGAMAKPSDLTEAGGATGGNGASVAGNRTYHITINVASSDELLDEGFVRRFMRVLDSGAREGGLSPEPETA